VLSVGRQKETRGSAAECCLSHSYRVHQYNYCGAVGLVSARIAAVVTDFVAPPSPLRQMMG
jgi:hypothetical protein